MRTRAALLVSFALSAFGQVKLPPYTRDVLPNGAVVMLMPRPGVPLVHFRVAIRGGAESEPSQMAGLANLTAQLLRRGTSKRTADQFSEEIDFLGGTFFSSRGAISAEFLKKDFDRGLDLLADAVLRSAFPEPEVKKELARMVDANKSLKDNPQPAIANYFLSAFYGPQHPYGHPPEESTLIRIQRKDVADYHASAYCGRNLIVVAAGDFDPAAAKSRIAAAFGAAPAGTAWKRPPLPELQRQSKLVLIDKPDATQTYFVIAQPGMDARNPDRVAIDIVNTLFGGRFTSMLNEELRVNTGLTYGASSNVEEQQLQGAIAIRTFTKAETTARAIDLALDTLKRLGDKGITQTQLDSAKAYVKGLYPTRQLETIDQLASKLAELELYGLGRDEIDTLFARIDAVTLDQANAVARKYYRSDKLTLVVLGPAAKIRESVAKYDPKPIELSIKQPGWGEW